MADDGFSLTDALAGQNAPNAQQSQGQGWPGWGGQNPAAGQQFPGYPGQPYQGFPGPQYPGQPYPGAPGQPAGPGAPPASGQQFPAPGQPYPGQPVGPGAPPAAGQQFPGPGQPYPGYPGPGQQYPGFSGPGQQYPGAPGQPAAFGDGKASAPIYPGPLKVPYELPLPSGLVQRQLFNIQGAINNNAKSFTINFCKGRDIPFHLNPRFLENPKVIVRNSLLQDKWGQEERQAPKFPFVPGQPFKIQILCESDKFNVAINNESLFQFRHRVKELNEIKSVGIFGDITLSDVSLTMA